MDLASGLLTAVVIAGFRHGFDLDHIAAITDITSSQVRRSRALYLATIYAGGHALVLVALGLLAIFAGLRIPPGLDSLMGRAIGLTLVALGAYVVYSLIRFRRTFRVRSRWMIVLAGIRRTLLWLRRTKLQAVEIEHAHEHALAGHHPRAGGESPGPASGGVAVKTTTHTHVHTHVVSAPSDPFVEYGVATSLGVGAIHGVGAETPTQVLLLTTAAGVAGGGTGLVVLLAFVLGLFLGNLVLALATSSGYAHGRKLPGFYTALAGVTAGVSLYVGTLYMLGRSDLIPSFLGG